MSKRMFAQLCATVAVALVTLALARGVHSVGGAVVFGVGVLATVLSAFRVRAIRMREVRERERARQQEQAR